MSRVVHIIKRRWKAILVMTALFIVGIAIGASGDNAQSADVKNAAASVAKTVTVEGEPVTVTETQTETVKKRVVKWRTKIKRITNTVTETVQASSGGGGGGAGGSCHPSYKGACLSPSASDYDCGGGSGNGPEYVWATVRVVGYDEYGLDSDGDGYGCE